VGILSAALKKEALSPEGYEQMIASTTRLNTAGPDLAALAGVHALTDVTGFGLAGHALEMARGAGLDVQINWSAVPLLSGVQGLAQQGFITGASGRNWAGYGEEVVLPEGFSPIDQAMLSDPQTSGGLLVSCAPDALEAVMSVFAQHGFEHATVVGSAAQKKGDKPVLRVV
jgi:selenide, water dikinase